MLDTRPRAALRWGKGPKRAAVHEPLASERLGNGITSRRFADTGFLVADNGAPSPELLDTRGYVLHLLGRQQEAVDDLNIAIDSAQNERRRLLLLAGHVDPGELAYRLRSANHGLAVMHHHRGLACRALGLVGQAEQDLAVAEKKGFDPTRGIF